MEALCFFSKETLGTKGRVHFTQRQNGFGLDKRQAGAPTSQDETHKKKNKHLLFYLHATAWWDFTAISVPGDLWLGETANPRRWDDGPLALRD